MAKTTRASKTAKTKAKTRRVSETRASYARQPGTVDVRAQQLPVGDREDVDQEDAYLAASLREDDLGPITLPSPQDAHRVLRELASLYHARHSAAQRHARLRSQAKEAADALADLDARIAERIRVATHRTGLPLFADEERTGTLD